MNPSQLAKPFPLSADVPSLIVAVSLRAFPMSSSSSSSSSNSHISSTTTTTTIITTTAAAAAAATTTRTATTTVAITTTEAEELNLLTSTSTSTSTSTASVVVLGEAHVAPEFATMNEQGAENCNTLACCCSKQDDFDDDMSADDDDSGFSDVDDNDSDSSSDGDRMNVEADIEPVSEVANWSLTPKYVAFPAAIEVYELLRQSWNPGTKTFMYRSIPGVVRGLARNVNALMKQAKRLLQAESLLLYLPSNVVIFGDVHGSFDGLLYFTSNSSIQSPLPYGYLFLGDYVDRGPHSVEVVIYLLACKCLWPSSVFLLRGNHEDPCVNGNEDYYGEGSFLSQCKANFGRDKGSALWKRCNDLVFSQLPLAAVVAKKYFCCHGGIPCDYDLERLSSRNFPRLPSVNDFTAPPGLSQATYSENRSVFDILWSDPIPYPPGINVSSPQAPEFGKSNRGLGVVGYYERAVHKFLEKYKLQGIIRGHEFAADGIEYTMGRRVTTVFTSPNYEGHGNFAAVVFVRQSDDGATEVVPFRNTSTADSNYNATQALTQAVTSAEVVHGATSG